MTAGLRLQLDERRGAQQWEPASGSRRPGDEARAGRLRLGVRGGEGMAVTGGMGAIIAQRPAIECVDPSQPDAVAAEREEPAVQR
jgi:hypothetical protein